MPVHCPLPSAEKLLSVGGNSSAPTVTTPFGVAVTCFDVDALATAAALNDATSSAPVATATCALRPITDPINGPQAPPPKRASTACNMAGTPRSTSSNDS